MLCTCHQRPRRVGERLDGWTTTNGGACTRLRESAEGGSDLPLGRAHGAGHCGGEWTLLAGGNVPVPCGGGMHEFSVYSELLIPTWVQLLASIWNFGSIKIQKLSVQPTWPHPSIHKYFTRKGPTKLQLSKIILKPSHFLRFVKSPSNDFFYVEKF